MSEWQKVEFGKFLQNGNSYQLIKSKQVRNAPSQWGPFGSNIKAENFVSSGVPVIQGANLNEIEQYVIDLFVQNNYRYLSGVEIAPDGSNPLRAGYEDVLLLPTLEEAVARLNSHVPPAARADAIRRIQRLNAPDLIANNEAFHRLLTEGIPVTYQQDGHPRGDLVWLCDFAEPTRNGYVVANQITVVSTGSTTVTKRPDLISLHQRAAACHH